MINDIYLNHGTSMPIVRGVHPISLAKGAVIRHDVSEEEIKRLEKEGFLLARVQTDTFKCGSQEASFIYRINSEYIANEKVSIEQYRHKEIVLVKAYGRAHNHYLEFAELLMCGDIEVKKVNETYHNKYMEEAVRTRALIIDDVWVEKETFLIDNNCVTSSSGGLIKHYPSAQPSACAK